MKYTIKTFRKDFPNDDRCLEYIFRARFPEEKKYKHEKGTTRFSRGKGYKHINPMSGTIFEGSPTPLSLWFYAIYLFSVSKNGVSAKELERQLGVAYNTAWRMAKQIRKLMEQDGDKLTGIVEIDESFISRKPVLGAIERGGKAKIKVADNINGASVGIHAIKNIDTNAKLMSDDHRAYAWLDRHYNRQSVVHSREYVRGNVHINSMESFWSNIKRSIAGTHHFVSPKHLQSYLDFFAFQHEHRTSAVPPFLVLLSKACV